MTLPCDGNVCFAGSESRDLTDDDTAEALTVRTDLDKQIESIRASVDLQVLSTGNNPTKMNVVRSLIFLGRLSVDYSSVFQVHIKMLCSSQITFDVFRVI